MPMKPGGGSTSPRPCRRPVPLSKEFVLPKKVRGVKKPTINPTSVRLSSELQEWLDAKALEQKRSRQYIITEYLEQAKAFDTKVPRGQKKAVEA